MPDQIYGNIMRKMIVELSPNMIMKIAWKDMFTTVEYLEGRALLKIDFERKTKLAIADIKMKDGYTLDDLKMPKEATILDVLKVDRNKYTCLIKVQAKRRFSHIFKLFNLNIIYDVPYYASKEKLVFSCIGDNESLEKLLKVIKVLGKVKDIRFQKATFQEYEMLNCLTDKQKDVMIAARKYGYYNYPREINSEKLAEKVGLSKATTIEHLRKAEGRIVEQLLAGY